MMNFLSTWIWTIILVLYFLAIFLVIRLEKKNRKKYEKLKSFGLKSFLFVIFFAVAAVSTIIGDTFSPLFGTIALTGFLGLFIGIIAVIIG